MRKGKLERETKETKISVSLDLDGSGKRNISTGIGFFDHMLELFAVHGSFDLDVKCDGDLNVDAHHSVEDVGIVLGKLIAGLLGDKKGVERYAETTIPMDEALVSAVIDLSGRPFLAFGMDISGQSGEFPSELCEEFFRAVVSHGMFTLHIRRLDGKNLHHTIEAAFKAFARSLKKAVQVTGDRIPSSKGTL